MFDWMFEPKETETEKEIKRICERRAKLDPASNEYCVLNARLRELLELKGMEKPSKPGFQHVTGDGILKTLGLVVLGGGIIFKEEIFGPIATKALPLLTKIV